MQIFKPPCKKPVRDHGAKVRFSGTTAAGAIPQPFFAEYICNAKATVRSAGMPYTMAMSESVQFVRHSQSGQCFAMIQHRCTVQKQHILILEFYKMVK